MPIFDDFYLTESNLEDLESKFGTPRGAHKVGGRALHPCGGLVALLAQLFCFGGFFWSIKNHRKFSGQLDSVWYSISVKLKNKEKTKTGTGL